MIEWAHGRGMELTVIEVMPLGDIGESRLDQYLPLSFLRAHLSECFTLEDIDYRTGGPARYVRVKETGGRLGFITPLTHNFCNPAIAFGSPAPARSLCARSERRCRFARAIACVRE